MVRPNRKAITLVSLVVLLVCFSAAHGAQKVELSMWQMWGIGHEKEVLDSMIGAFERENPGITIADNPFDDYAKVLTAITSGDAPDIVDLWDLSTIGEWASRGMLTQLDGYIKKDKIDKGRFIPAAWQAVTYKRHVYAMPFIAFNECLLYNKGLFRKVGLDPNKPPKTLEQLAAYAEKLTKVDADGKIVQMGFVPNWPTSHIATSLVWINGGDYYDAKANRVTVNSPAVVKALTWERKFYTKYGPQKVQNFVSSGGQYLTAQDLFESGKVAMVIDGSWVIRYIQANVPALDKEIGAAYIPVTSTRPELYGTGFVGINPQIIPKGAKHPAEAWKFISWLTTDSKRAATFADLVANLPHLKDVPETGILKDARFKVFIDAARSKKARVVPIIAISNQLNTKLSDVENQVLLDPKADIKGLLDKLNEELNESLQEAEQ